VTARRRLLALAAGLVAVFVVVLAAVGRDPEQLRRDVDAAGAWAPVAYVALTAGLTMAFFPFPVVAAAGGLLFGVAAGTALAVTGEVLGACGAFLVARRLGARAVTEIAGARVRRLIEAVSRRGFVAVLYARIIPGMPRHPANYAFGVTAVGFLAFVTATTIGTAPRAFAYAALGGTLGNLDSAESFVAIGLLVAMGLLGVGLLLRERRRARAAGSGTATSSPAGRSVAPR
jgi:uncharacterized membrane protein YdjX (TVP38/TMEM64 family)